MEFSGKMVGQAEKNQLLKRYLEVGIKEGLFSDMAGALGHMRRNLVKCAYPQLIGRKIISWAPTNEPSERFPIDNGAIAYTYTEGATTRLSGKKNEVVTISCGILADASEKCTREFIEDATWNTFENFTENVSNSLAAEETKRVISLYEAVSNGDLAGGGALDQNNHLMDWNAVLKLHNAVRGKNLRPTVLVMNEVQLGQLLLDNRFIEYDYLPSSEVDLEQGIVRKVLGMNVQSSTLVPNGTVYAIDTRYAGKMLVRRDITVEDWNDPATGDYGVRATTRFGLGVLRSNAIAKMINVSTSLD